MCPNGALHCVYVMWPRFWRRCWRCIKYECNLKLSVCLCAFCTSESAQAQTATKIVCIFIKNTSTKNFVSLTCALAFFALNLSDANGTPFACTAPQLQNQLDKVFAQYSQTCVCVCVLNFKFPFKKLRQLIE